MAEIVESISRVTDMIGEISAGAREQSMGIGQINTAVGELDTMTQQNAAMVGQTNAAAAEMREQAERLNATIASFRLSDDTDTASPRHNPPPAPLSTAPARSAVKEQAEEWVAF